MGGGIADELRLIDVTRAAIDMPPDIVINAPGGNHLALRADATSQAMPRLTGLALTQRQRRRQPELPVMLCSGHAETAPPDALQELGIQALLHKPIDSRRLRDLVQKCLAVPRS